MVCRGLMLDLHRKGLIELPPLRRRPPNPLARRARPEPVAIDRTPVRGTPLGCCHCQASHSFFDSERRLACGLPAINSRI